MKDVKGQKKQRFLRTPGRRGSAVNAGAALLAFFMFLVVMVDSGMMPGVSSRVDSDQATTAYWDKVNSSIEGTIYDRNGTVLCSAADRGTPGTLTYPESTSFLLGYNSLRYGQSGLRSMYRDVLLDTDENGKGGSLNLTLDIDLQNDCQSQLSGHEGAIIVMNWRTGALLAAASSSDPNSAAPTRGQRLCTSLSNIIGDTTLSRLSFPSIPQGTACPPDRHRPHINRAYSIGIIRFSPEKSRLFRGKCKFFYRLYRRLRYSFQVLRDRVRETVALLMPSSWAMRVTDMFRE